ncbi:hypothetical protein [Sphingomonas sp. BE137]|jgi:hypothetical protein|uniref:hypothetical protein n=1 Tax=Sphingomonas sp. BE137 TaxID=2817844 RepID=UPI001AE69FA8|nr:hypothetical protein [Sphingomonas sp. BE137]MDR6846985.1 hypothetical protein [Sphingomonas sp. BE137]
MVAIACLGWGSLFWDPDGLPVSDWKFDGPELPIEFARLSGGGRVTLVLMSGGPRVPVLWTILDIPSLDAAVSALRAREKTKSAWIGRWPSEGADQYSDEIGEWATRKGLDGVVWTAIPPKWADEDGRAPSKEEVVGYLASLTDDEAVEPFKYVRRAPEQIQTPYRPTLMKFVGA